MGFTTQGDAPLLQPIFSFLKDELNAYIRYRETADQLEDAVTFVSGGQGESTTFQMDRVSVLMVNLEEETTMRPADPYAYQTRAGATITASPDIRLNLYLLFIANAREYETALQKLSYVIRYFQSHRRIDRLTAPALPKEVEHLVIELVTLSFAEQNEVWGSLRAPYLPSVMYRVRMAIFRADDGLAGPAITEKQLNLNLQDDQ